MPTSFFWKYQDPFGTVRHAFYSLKSRRALCGQEIFEWMYPTWKADEQRLKVLRPCKRCVDQQRRLA